MCGNKHRPSKPLELLLRGCSEEAVRRVNDNRSFLQTPARLEVITVLPADDKGPVSVTKIIDGAELVDPAFRWPHQQQYYWRVWRKK